MSNCDALNSDSQQESAFEEQPPYSPLDLQIQVYVFILHLNICVLCYLRVRPIILETLRDESLDE